MTNPPRVFLIGYGTTTETALRSLTACTSVVGLLRDTVEHSDPVITMAHSLAIPVFGPALPEKLGCLLNEAHPDCVVISSYNRIIRSDLLANRIFINVHYAPLPRYRGRASVNWAIINGEPTTAITIHLVDTGLDSGNILYQKEIPISRQDTVTDLYQRLNSIQEQHLGEAVLRVSNGWTGIPQDDALATYGCARTSADGEINWSASAVTIDRLVRALTPPFPGAFTYFEGRRFIIWRVEQVNDQKIYSGRVPGRIISLSQVEGWVDVLAGEGVVRIHDLETESGERRKAAEVFRSTRASLGLRTADLQRLVRDPSERLVSLERGI